MNDEDQWWSPGAFDSRPSTGGEQLGVVKDLLIRGGSNLFNALEQSDETIFPGRRDRIKGWSEGAENLTTRLTGNETAGNVVGALTQFGGEVIHPDTIDLAAGAATLIPEPISTGSGVVGLAGNVVRKTKRAVPDLVRAIEDAFNPALKNRKGAYVLQGADGSQTVVRDSNGLVNNVFYSTTQGGGISPFSTIPRKLPTTFTGNNLTSLNDFIKAGNTHASGLLNQGRKKNLLKGFNNRIVDDNGVEFMLQRGPNNTFKVTSVHDAELRLLRQSGYTGTSKEMQALRSQINRELGQRPGTRYWDILAEGSKDTYIEHLVAKGQDWFWKLKDKDPNFATWINPNRNSAFNLRILNNRRWKTLKDRVEQIIYPRNYIDGGTSTKIVDGKTVYTGNLKPLEARIVIAAEDPLTSISGKVVSQQDKKLMGHLVIKRATTGETIGKIPEYLQDLYSPSFKHGFNKNLPELIKNGIVKEGESLDAFRTRFLNERIDFIIDEAPLLNERAQKIIHKYAGHSDPLASAKSAVIDEAVLEDLTRFKAIFPWLRVQPGMMKHYIQNAKY
tara:strand:- start:117 stop:1793 length:1677 start_codon:yes stop_codon:yes gene_type:complete